MKTSVVIRTRDEAPRLRLTLASLEGQAGLDEVVVVDDGATDATAQVIAAASDRLPIRQVRHAEARGRSAASNAGAMAATGAIVIFLDGDTLAGPGMVARHRQAHEAGQGVIGRGETWHLRCTRFLDDPEAGTFRGEEASRAMGLSEARIAALRVTSRQVREDFASIEDRAAPGVYPGAAPRRLYEAEIDALHRRGNRLWAAASGSNLSVERARFLGSGGFDAAIDINEHRELSYRLCQEGARMAAVRGARTYHLTHRSGWRDPLIETRWEAAFTARHPQAPIAELKSFWAACADSSADTDFFAR